MVMLSRSKVVGVALALMAAGAVLYFWPRREPGVPEAITRQVITMTRAAEQKDISGVMEGVSERFKTDGGWDNRQVRGVLTGQVLRGQWVRIFTTNLEVHEVSPTQGDFQARFIFGRSQAENLKDLAADSVLNAYLIEGTFEKETDGEWRIVRAKYRPLEASELL
ncbi:MULTISPECIES: hypothetical protein [Myxococcus]|uniref:SnoaL-like domain-containing protein n=1 Tax=Myxococcus llanfairpwllgwyngyllgogerychwyrndrobwllllantysiliogogogochensis TaxID=2590453 RepID=A0A540WPA5_9BACT|nr:MULTISPECIES: hypothetical protein [Myxococcus]NTX04214.1 hypothetical protein [Myxococcus sp. CA040A]NTX36383.1 hypothetical protein [Myxococcus sp. CA033]TQF10826.1 hypothetical protein FJV41_37430 [Myxococcus llanfairpwllgwyngyllgogerychwyrndrobwllllantysiliogogogochensis]